MEDNKTSTMGATVATFAAGALIGAGLGVLTAPKAGTETRAELRKAGLKAKSKMMDTKEKVSSTVRDKLQTAKSKVNDESEPMLPVA